MDANGNTSAIWSLGGVAGFGYDDRNRLALVQRNLKTVMRYVLNGRGERVRKELATKQAPGRDFIYDKQGRLIAEYTDRNGGSKDYVWADDTLVGVLAGTGARDAQLQYIYTDGLGTPRALTGAGGKITLWAWPARQNPFGERSAIGMPDALNLRFPGQYFDGEIGLHYNYFRDYEPGAGRYVQSDPIGLQGGASTYAYVGSRPLNAYDPKGLKMWTIYWGLGGGVGHIIVGGSVYELQFYDPISAKGCTYLVYCAELGVGLPEFGFISPVTHWDDGQGECSSCDTHDGYGLQVYASAMVGAGISIGGSVSIPNGPTLTGDLVNYDGGAVRIGTAINLCRFALQ